MSLVTLPEKKHSIWHETFTEERIDAYPYEYKKMNPCEYCEYGSVCGFDLQLEGCHYRRLSALDKDEVWQEIAREENKQTDKEEREDG